MEAIGNQMPEYRETLTKWTERVNTYNMIAQINIIFRILFNILWVLYYKNIITFEQADSLTKYGD